MQAIAQQPGRTIAGRVAYAMLAAALVALIVLELARHGTGWWQLGVFGMGADVALFAGMGRGLERGQLHPRAVHLYNALHRFYGAGALLLAAAAGMLGPAWLIAGFAWAFHVALDRALGYGLRTREGFQRA
jgi:Domain of unknown function (DUF4260)